MNKYDGSFKDTIIELHLKEGRTIKSLTDEYHVSRASIQNWVRAYNKECHENADKKEERDHMKEINKLRKELEESKKEIEFLKKAAAFFVKEID